MPHTSLLYSPSIEGASSGSLVLTDKPSLFNTKDDFIERIAPVATAAIYFGSFSLAPRDPSLARQALYKLSFLHRHFLQPAGLRVEVKEGTAHLTGTLTNPSLSTLAEILALQIEGISKVKNETKVDASADSASEALQFLFATDQTLRSGVSVRPAAGQLTLEGEVSSTAQKNWAEQLAALTGSSVDSKLKLSTFIPPPHTPVNAPPQIDDESLQALVLFRLRLVHDMEHHALKVKATRGVVTLQGKVATEAQRQSVENIARSTLGIRELRSSLSLGA